MKRLRRTWKMPSRREQDRQQISQLDNVGQFLGPVRVRVAGNLMAIVGGIQRQWLRGVYEVSQEIADELLGYSGVELLDAVEEAEVEIGVEVEVEDEADAEEPVEVEAEAEEEG